MTVESRTADSQNSRERYQLFADELVSDALTSTALTKPRSPSTHAAGRSKSSPARTLTTRRRKTLAGSRIQVWPEPEVSVARTLLRLVSEETWRHGRCTFPAAKMAIHRKADRRLKPERRARTRSGRRAIDPTDSRCPKCKSLQVEFLGVQHGVWELRCRDCKETWVTVPRKPK
jgi:hypothetical protein